ncbi:MAG: hypothetical protein K2R98_14340 [Gemmataceae bacterium]|nr:hypothetical protein [Gemmataceae bacterium]
MLIQLSDKEVAILLGATLMHWGVPFHSITKRELTDDQQVIVDAASDRLIAWREAHQGHGVLNGQEIPLSDYETVLLIEVVEDCLAECGNDATDLSLHLKASARHEVETLASRLRHSLPPGTRNSHAPQAH